MPLDLFNDEIRLKSARRFFSHLADKLNTRISVRLWDGSMIPLGKNVDTDYFVSINDPYVFSDLLHSPSLENMIHLYASGRMDIHARDLIDFMDVIRQKEYKDRLRDLDKGLLFGEGLIFLLSPGKKIDVKHEFGNNETGTDQSKRNNRDYIQFHYDVSNEFYSLFLDPEMQYSCAYFTDTNNSLEQAQRDKLEIICRKLRLKPKEKLLDIGSGWGGLSAMPLKITESNRMALPCQKSSINTRFRKSKVLV